MKYWGVASQWTGIPHREHSEYSQLLYAMKTRINWLPGQLDSSEDLNFIINLFIEI